MSMKDKIINKFTICDALITLVIGFAITLSITTVIGFTPVVGAIAADMPK